MKCFGDNTNGALGYEDSVDHGITDLATIALGTNYVLNASSWGSVSMSGHTCTISTDTALKCWGFGLYYQLGNGQTEDIGDGAGEMGNNLQPIFLG
eukprot:CAMPEP_0202710312 /NCGR_PEP_ID=MMETSP1385-20130828/22310_1 /ASSEMBLY_ACC=CAM_ASM_000861 /TAXON_ID=933848 /ORGANISM="Elphidium margaritaceum" /LENGTH=95 /DNA_ID=CAMNT_0049369815 /DNA_START=4 /DNA_END=287 /DNA_ORIENTATION=+